VVKVFAAEIANTVARKLEIRLWGGAQVVERLFLRGIWNLLLGWVTRRDV
jgi:hypothetical protein